MLKKIAFAASFIAVSPVLAQQAPAPAELYGARESVEQIDISPDGQHVVYLQPGPGRTTVVFLADVGSTAVPRTVLTSAGNPERLRWCQFVTNDRLVCAISGMTVLADGTLVPFSRMMALDTQGHNVAPLGQSNSFFDSRLRQYDGEIIDYLPDQTALLMARDHVAEEGHLGTRLVRSADGVGVDRIDLRTMRATAVEVPNASAGGYISDGRGQVRIMVVPGVRGGATGQQDSRIQFFYRREGSRDWQPFVTYDTLTHEGTLPVAVDPVRNAAYVFKRLNGRQALYRIKLDGSMATELVYANEHVDVDGLATLHNGGRVIGVSYVEDRTHINYFEADYSAMARSIARAIPNLPLIDFVDASADGNRVLVHAGSDTDAGRYYVYDRTAHSLNEILMARSPLEHVAGGTEQAVTYPGSDGVQIPAYLTLPPGGANRNLPTIVLPHGGPSARDVWGFDWLAQYFAHLGYAVLQPNYRGSAGFGEQWLQQNGFRSWRTSIGDISAGARWLVAQGIADPHRMAIVGWSYGGYAALQSAATEPNLYRAVVAIAPVTDLQQVKDDARRYTDATNTAEFIGSGPHIAEGSPLRNVAAITAPVLLFHGERDFNVNVIHSRRMDQALRGAGKSSELVLFPGLEHDLPDSDARTRMLQRIGDFLSTTLAAH